MAESTSRAAGAHQLTALLYTLANGPVPPKRLLEVLGLPRTTLFRLRRQATDWQVVILASPVGWEVVDWGFFSRSAIRTRVQMVGLFHVKHSLHNQGEKP